MAVDTQVLAGGQEQRERERESLNWFQAKNTYSVLRRYNNNKKRLFPVRKIICLIFVCSSSICQKKKQVKCDYDGSDALTQMFSVLICTQNTKHTSTETSLTCACAFTRAYRFMLLTFVQAHTDNNIHTFCPHVHADAQVHAICKCMHACRTHKNTQGRPDFFFDPDYLLLPVCPHSVRCRGGEADPPGDSGWLHHPCAYSAVGSNVTLDFCHAMCPVTPSPRRSKRLSLCCFCFLLAHCRLDKSGDVLSAVVSLVHSLRLHSKASHTWLQKSVSRQACSWSFYRTCSKHC